MPTNRLFVHSNLFLWYQTIPLSHIHAAGSIPATKIFAFNIKKSCSISNAKFKDHQCHIIIDLVVSLFFKAVIFPRKKYS